MSKLRGSILLVDDEEKILKALGRPLRDAGHAVVDTASAREAQRLLAERPFDVFIVDNVMPEKSGLDLIREYVGSTPDGRGAGAPGPGEDRAQIVMMTAHATTCRSRSKSKSCSCSPGGPSKISGREPASGTC